MKPDTPLIRWLTLAALADWLIVRTLARSAIFMPKPPALVAAYQVITSAGQMAALIAALLALVTIVWLAWHGRDAFRGLRSLALLNLLFLGLAFQVVPPAGWLLVIDQLLLILLVLWMGMTGIRRADRIEEKTAALFPTLALVAGALYQSVPSVFTALRLPGPPPFLNTLFNLGELSVVLSGFGFWWAYGKKKTGERPGTKRKPDRSRLPGDESPGYDTAPHQWGFTTASGFYLREKSRMYPAQHSSSAMNRRADFTFYSLAAVPALVFTAMHWANPSMTGILAIWSSGLTLYLPWPLYALSLYLATATVLITLRKGSPVGWAVLLLAAAGYAPQLSTQIFIGLIGLSLLAVSTDEFTFQRKLHPGSGQAQPDHSSPYHPHHSEA